MKIGVLVNNFGGFPETGRGARACVDLARHAERLGFDSVWVTDHVVLPRTIRATYPHSREGFPYTWEQDIHEPLVLMAALAEATERVEIGVSVLVIPYRHPLLTAKMLATIDQLSGGRIILGAGVERRHPRPTAGVRIGGTRSSRRGDQSSGRSKLRRYARRARAGGSRRAARSSIAPGGNVMSGTTRQRFRIERQIRVPRELVWESLLDVLSAAGYALEGDPPPHGRGSIIKFRIGDYDLVEETLSLEPPWRRRYALAAGAPLDAYEAVITIEPMGEECRLEWSYIADPGGHPDALAFLEQARRALTFAADHIVADAEGRRAASVRG